MQSTKSNLKNILLISFIFYSFVLPQTSINLPTDNPLESPTDSIVHSSIRPFFENSSKVGISIGLFYKGKEYFYNYGSEQKEKILLPTQRTIYEIGSITKTFCGTILAQAVKDKKVELDDDIRLYLNDNYKNLEYSGTFIKLYQLLNHSSGLPFDFIDRKKYENINKDSLVFILANVENKYSREQFFRDLHKVKLDTIPGIKLNYSNVAAQLLSYILEKVYQKPFSKLVSELITSPEKMKNTAFQFTGAMVDKIAKGYNEIGRLMPHFNSEAAGGLYSTTEDLLKYGKLHLNEKNSVIALTHKPTWGQIQYFAFGLNWQMQQNKESFRRIWQSGGNAGYTSLLVVYPELDYVIVLLSNEHDENSEGDLSSVEKKIFNGLLSK